MLSADVPNPPALGRWLVFLAGVVLPLLTVGWLGDELLEGERFRFEAPLMLQVHRWSTPSTDALALFFHVWGGPWIMTGVMAVLTAWSWQQFGRRAARFTLLGPGSAVALGSVMKLVFHRPRPELWPRLVHESSASFPSGHATMSAALATWVVLLLWPTRYRWAGLAAALLYAGLVGVSRVALGVHYPTDVLAGWLTGTALVLGTFQLMGRPLWSAGRASAAQLSETAPPPVSPERVP